jgi:hypothetical protein
MNRFLRICRTIHSWLGALVMPWVLIIGATGFYLNHSQMVLKLIGYAELLESDLDGSLKLAVTPDLAQNIAASVWTQEPVLESGFMKYRGEKSLAIKKASGMIIIPGPSSNHYFVRTNWKESTFNMDGKLVHQQYNLKPILKSLHERGWLGSTFGTWFADAVAVAMVFFGFSGMIMWATPKLRKLRGFLRTSRGGANARPTASRG